MTDKETYNKELDKVTKELDKVAELLKEQLDSTPIEFIDLYQYISLIDTLSTKKQKLIYLSAMEDCRQ